VLDCAPDHVSNIRARLYTATQDFNRRAQGNFRLSMSVGAASRHPGKVVGLEALLEEADRRMYAEKRARAGSSRANMPVARLLDS
jgi:GGDEF domain-containing protein